MAADNLPPDQPPGATDPAAALAAIAAADTEAARRAHAQQAGVLRLGYVINVCSYLAVMGVLGGCFYVMTGGPGVQIDPGVAAMLGGIIGAAVQWLFANASQANGFFFGSSPGSRQLASDLGKAVANQKREPAPD